MKGIEFNGQMYNDDRMFVLYLCKGTVNADGTATTIYHEEPPDNSKWCLVTYRNVPRYPAVRVDHFDTLEEAQAYIKKVEPTVPLISLGGKGPRVQLPYNEFVKWKTDNGFREYDFKAMYQPGGANLQEILYTNR